MKDPLILSVTVQILNGFLR